MNVTDLGIHIKVKDIEVSKKFYDSLGFKTVFAYGDEEFRASFTSVTSPEKYRGVVYQLKDNTSLEIADGHIGIKNQNVFNEQIVSEKVSAMIKVDTLEDLFSNPNVGIVFPVRKYYWGTIEVALRDPDGFVLVFIAPYSEDELKMVKKYHDVQEVKGE